MGFQEEVQAPSLIPSIDPNLAAGSMTLDVPKGAQAPSLMSQFTAGFNRQNEISSFFMRKDTGVDNGLDPAYDAWTDIKGTQFENYWETFASVNNQRYADAMKQQIMMERGMTQTLEASGFTGILGSIAGGLASPLTFIPGTGLLKAVRGGYSIAGSTLRTGAMAAASTAAQEGLLQATQETRTGMESAEAIGFSFVLGGLLGGGIAGLLNRGDVAKAERGFNQLNKILNEPQVATPPPVAEGFVRFYHGGENPTSGGGRWVTTDPTYARDFGTGSNKVNYVDIPKGDATEIAARAWDELDEGGRNPMAVGRYNHIEVPEEWAKRMQPFETVSSSPGNLPVGLGAQANDVNLYSQGDLSVAGRLNQAILNVIHDINPGLRGMQNIIPEAQLASQQLTETPLYSNLNFKGGSVGPAVETFVRMDVGAQMARAVDKVDAAFKEMKKVGIKMTRNQFEEEVGKLMRRGDVGQNPHVNKAAEAYRTAIFNPGRDAMVSVLHLPADIKAIGGSDGATAVSYISRMHNQKKLIAEEPQYKDAIRPDAMKMVEDGYAKSVEEAKLKIKELEQDIQELSLTGTARVDAMADIEAALQRADMEHPEAALAREQMKELRSQAAKLKKEGKIAESEAARVRANEIGEQAKEARKAYTEAVRPILRSRKNIEGSAGSMAEEAEKIRGQLIDAEEGQLRTLNRLVQRGRKVEREIGKIDDLDLETKVTQLKENFADIASKFDDGAKQTRVTIDKMKADAEQALKDRRLAQYSPEGTFQAIQAMSKVDIEAAAKRREMIGKLEKIEEQQKQRSARMNAISAKLDETESIDPVAMRQAVKDATDELLAEISTITSKRSERMLRLIERLADTDPAKVKAVQALRQGQIDKVKGRFFSRWEGVDANLEGRPAKLAAVADDIVNDYFEKVSGRNRFGDHSNLPEYAVSVTKGPMKDRTLWVKDTVVEPWLESNARLIAERYSRIVAAEVELTKRFGSANLEEIVGEHGTIREGAKRLRDEVDAATDVAQIKKLTGKNFGKDLAEAKGKARTFINDQLEEALSDVNSLRNILRRTYAAEQHSSDWGRVLKAGIMINYIRLSGGFGITSLNDIFMSAFRHGLMPFMNEAVIPLVRGLEGAKLSVQEAKLMGLVVERVNQHKMMALMEINDRFAQHTPFERLLSNMSNLASKFNGLQYTQDAGEAITAILAQNRVIDSVMNGKNNPLMNMLGMGQMEKRLQDQMGKFAERKDGVWVANTGKWTDVEAMRTYRAMVSKDVTSTVVRPGIADKPLFGHTPVGSAILQFLPFQLAANQRIMMRGLQESPARFATGLVALSGIGIGIAYLKSLSQGKEAHEKFMKNANNPGWLIAEGLDASGLLTMPFMLSNDIEKVTKAMGNPFNPIKTPIRAMGGSQPETTGSFNQDILRSLVGPTFSLPTDAIKLGDIALDTIQGKDLSSAQKKSMQYMVPWGTFMGIRDGLQGLRGDHVLQR